MPSKKEILDQISALQAEADSMSDGDDDFEIEIWNKDGEGARLPHSQSRRWLGTKFPDLFDPEPSGEEDSSGDPESKSTSSKKQAKPANSVATGKNVAGRYFAKRTTGK